MLSCPYYEPSPEDRASVPLVFETPAYSSDWFTKQHEQRQEYSHRRKLRESAGGSKASTEEIQHQYDIQMGRCFYCGCELGNNYHVDHYMPLSLGGSNSADNIRIACPSCNLRKGGKHPAAFAR